MHLPVIKNTAAESRIISGERRTTNVHRSLGIENTPAEAAGCSGTVIITHRAVRKINGAAGQGQNAAAGRTKISHNAKISQCQDCGIVGSDTSSVTTGVSTRHNGQTGNLCRRSAVDNKHLAGIVAGDSQQCCICSVNRQGSIIGDC